jgi:glycerol-1-phosphate dehydrogenase [NAD(P)+]
MATIHAKAKIDLPNFFEVGEHKTADIYGLLTEHGLKFKHVLFLGDHKTFLIGGGPIAHSLENGKVKMIRHLVSTSDEKNVHQVNQFIIEHKIDLVLGFGGGKVIDVAKLAAGMCSCRFISIPTILSNDGISSPIAVIKDSKKIPVSHLTKAPYGVIVDISIIKRAPSRHIRAGVGDLISNLSAVFDARLAAKKKIEKINPTALQLAEAGALNLLESMENALKCNDFLLMLTRGLIKSGFAMCIVGSSRPASGSEHKISHAIDHLYSPRKTLHGEQTGVAALFTMALQKNEHFEEVRALYEHIGFPTKVRKLYLNKDQFVKAVLNATNIRPDRYTILEDKTPTAKDIHEVLNETQL